MKILLITSIYLPHIGGIELYVKNLAASLIAKGHEVSIFVGDRFVKNSSDSVEYGIRTVRVPVFYLKGMSYLRDKAGRKILENELLSSEVVHLNDVKFLYKFLAQKKSLYGYKLFFSSHGFIFHTKSFLLLKKLYMKRMSKYSGFYNLNYCVSENDLKIAKSFNFSNLKMLIPGCDVKKFSGIDPNKFEKNFFVCFGRIAKNKGILELVKLFNSCNFDFSLKIIGKCDDDTYFQKIHSVSQHDARIEFLGYKTDDEIKEYIQTAEFLIFPSLHEGFGLTLVEALSSGKKIIANKIETFTQILTDCGLQEFLFDFSGDKNSLQEKIKELRKLPARKINLEKYSVKYMSDVIEKGYEELEQTI